MQGDGAGAEEAARVGGEYDPSHITSVRFVSMGQGRAACDTERVATRAYRWSLKTAAGASADATATVGDDGAPPAAAAALAPLPADDLRARSDMRFSAMTAGNGCAAEGYTPNQRLIFTKFSS